MAKYSFEFKKKVVGEYLNGNCGQKSLAKKYGIHHAIVERWIASYKHYGEEALM